MDVFNLLLLAINLSIVLSFNDIDETRYNEGKKQLQLMESRSEMPKYGRCWVNAMAIIHTGCKRLTDDTQSRLSLAYLNCFLKLQGRPDYPCSEEDSVESCVQDMSDSDRGSFTTFFTHTQNICYFLQAQVWHENTQQTIALLSDSSSQVAEQLENAHELQKDMLLSQTQSLENQELLMNQTVNLNNIINVSSHTVQNLFEDLRKSSQEQREVMGDLFDKLSNLQSTILGEVSGFYSLFYYVLSIMICYLLTSTPRTSDARVWLFFIMTIGVVTEQTVVPWLSRSWMTLSKQQEENEQVYWLQKLCRRLFILVALGALALCSYLYKDLNTMNNQLLLEIRKQNSDIRRSLSGQFLAVQAQDEPQHQESSDSDYTSDVSDGDSDTDSDKTFILPENKQGSDTESFMTLQDEDSPADQVSLLCELRDLRQSTPMRELATKVDDWLEKSSAASPSHRGSPYNLRPRTYTPSPNISPASRVESSKSFCKTVRQMQEIAEKNSRLIRAYQQNGSFVEASSIVTPAQPSPRNRNIDLQRQVVDIDRSSIVTRSSKGSGKR